MAAAESFGAAVGASDFAAACDMLAPATAASLASQKGSCAEGLEAAEVAPLTPITEVSVACRAAQVKSDGTATFLVVDAGRWRVLAVGCQEAGAERP